MYLLDSCIAKQLLLQNVLYIFISVSNFVVTDTYGTLSIVTGILVKSPGWLPYWLQPTFSHNHLLHGIMQIKVN